MRHNIRATRRKRQFQHHVIIRVREKWPPKEMDFLQMRVTRKKAQKPARIIRRLAGRQMLRAGQHLLSLAIKADGEAQLEFGGRNGTDQRKARAQPGAGRCHQNTGVEHDSHFAGSSTILFSSFVKP